MIHFKNVEKKIDNEFQLGPFSFHIEPGTVTALIGNNGAGKSTLIRLLTGMVLPDHGFIHRFNDGTEEEEAWKEYIGYVPQTSIGYERFTLKQLAELHNIGYKNWNEAEFDRLIKKFNLPLNKRFDSLSAGMQKQGLTILALARKTKLLIMDEPLSGVDIENQVMMREEWISYLEEDSERAILFATHVPEEVKEFADYIVSLNGGRLTGIYEKDELQQKFGRIWVKDSKAELYHLPGVFEVISDGKVCEIATKDLKKTEEALEVANIEIVMQNSFSFSEILRFLLQELRGEE
ncbi:ATP-binding cassette domain-containing protein [Evansella halocellulosilytica]|uniref:ATP-binding cassette domain-containing protein n=1 Tax=Evansella halocellulosilytica TaxID=2011013 RepID=UPI000BB8BD09|nr:ABC transporter ATP-binding protein [Evansella halocellulosilytica]